MTWLVLGGNGQLGRALSFVAKERGIDFVARGSKELDIRSATKTLDLISKLKPTVIINAAAWTDVDGAESNYEAAYETNAQGPLNLSIAAKAVKAVFVQVSTDYVFSGQAKLPWNVADVRDPANAYGKTKVAGEDAVLSTYPENSYVFRTAWLYSQWGKNFAKTITRLALTADQDTNGTDLVKVVDDQIGQPTFALDLSNQIIDTVLAKVPVGIYHLTNAGQASRFEFAQEIFRLAGADMSRIIPISTSEFPTPAERPLYSVLNNQALMDKPISPRRSWKLALADAMPAIVSAVKKGE
jgi:dTDP-4-dehydrorhamnose reductase